MRLRLATFNLESLDDRPDLVPTLAERIAILRPQLLRLDADILCLQEVNGQATGKHAPRRLNRDHRGNRSHADVDRSVITGAIGHRLVLDHPIDHARGRASGKHEID